MHHNTLKLARKILVESTVSDSDFIELCKCFMILADNIDSYEMAECNSDYDGTKDADARIVMALGHIALLGMQ